MLSDEASALRFMNLLTPKEQEQEQKGEEESNMESRKFCADCKTSKTPLWRGGPSGPKSLCNACGIRYRKKKRMVSMEPTNRTRSPDKKREREISHSRDSTSSYASATTSTASKCWSDSLRMSLVLLGKDLLLQSSNVGKKQRWQRKRKLGEEELAAVSLMALSCGSVFA